MQQKEKIYGYADLYIIKRILGLSYLSFTFTPWHFIILIITMLMHKSIWNRKNLLRKWNKSEDFLISFVSNKTSTKPFASKLHRIYCIDIRRKLFEEERIKFTTFAPCYSNSIEATEYSTNIIWLHRVFHCAYEYFPFAW